MHVKRSGKKNSNEATDETAEVSLVASISKEPKGASSNTKSIIGAVTSTRQSLSATSELIDDENNAKRTISNEKIDRTTRGGPVARKGMKVRQTSKKQSSSPKPRSSLQHLQVQQPPSAQEDTSTVSGSSSIVKVQQLKATLNANIRRVGNKDAKGSQQRVPSRRRRDSTANELESCEPTTSPPTTNSSSMSTTTKKVPPKKAVKVKTKRKTPFVPSNRRRVINTERSDMTQMSRSLQCTSTQDDSNDVMKSLNTDLLGLRNFPVLESRFREFVDTCLDVSMASLKREYEETRSVFPTKPQYAFFRMTKHSAKNRYNDIYCLDSTRVILRFPNRDDDNSFIHANYVEGRNLENKFILTQGPLVKTIGDFWRMVWQEKSSMIIMVCDNVEDEKKKCADYLPAKDKFTIADIVIQRKSEKFHKSALVETRLTLSYGSRERHEVTHWKWLGWPDHKVPDTDIRTPFRLLQMARMCKSVVVHCSAGVGRSGTLVAMELCFMDMLRGEELNVADCVKFLRTKRAHAVQTFGQYLFIYRALLDLAVSVNLVSEAKIQPFVDAYEGVMTSQ